MIKIYYHENKIRKKEKKHGEQSGSQVHDSKNCLPVVSYETCLISSALKCEMPSIKEPGQRPVPKDFTGGWSHRQAFLTKVLDLQ